jgi:hypothetical protein
MLSSFSLRVTLFTNECRKMDAPCSVERKRGLYCTTNLNGLPEGSYGAPVPRDMNYFSQYRWPLSESGNETLVLFTIRLSNFGRDLAEPQSIVV